ncbi:YnbE family lipoprotein [Magnetospira sp. QH-2]|uniref:YnbE family lipoprotein n=1 Tax=Magnetospira sp. (strain QH-2) TaxID=1288970 RepID=UPI0003E80D83|nr:YnbE family lipoprotein [Magnetospira sp. QH-2]CCQ73539.1 Putative lipoprotein [Magnetospira sp. QH-2]
MTIRRILPLLAALVGSILATACSPTVKVETPREPITINLNVKIEHEVRIKVEKDVDQLLTENPELFE